MISRFSRTAAILLGIASALAPTVLFAQTSDTATIDVDFSKAAPVKSPVGIFMGMSKDAPPDSAIKPLKPMLMRGGIENADRAVGLGARYEFTLSDVWGYPGDDFKGHGAPYRIWDAWDEFVTDTARKYKDKPVIWEIWNEPDLIDYWVGTQSQFFELYSRTYKILRKELGPNALIAGPSLSSYDRAYFEAFLEYASMHLCEVNVLTWHETSADASPASAREHLVSARKAFINNEGYKHLKIKEIHINEFGPDAITNYPAEQLLYLSSLEQGGADAACRMGWKDADGDDTLLNNTLDGLVTKTEFKPAAVWWTYKCYSDGVADRVAAAGEAGRVVAVASRSSDKPKFAQVMVGILPVKRQMAVKALSVNLKHVDTLSSGTMNGFIEAEWRLIPNSGEAAVSGLRSFGTNSYKVKAGSVTIPFNGTDARGVYVLTIK